jgi:hypothetical protein
MIYLSQTFDQLFYTLQTKDISRYLHFYSIQGLPRFLVFFSQNLYHRLTNKSIFNHHLNFKKTSDCAIIQQKKKD